MGGVQDFEKLGVFYLGREARMATGQARSIRFPRSRHARGMRRDDRQRQDRPVHRLIEEAAIDGIPSVVIDPKGDLANLLLTFPELWPARLPRRGSTRTRRAQRADAAMQFAAQQAELWRRGSRNGARTATRIRRLRERADSPSTPRAARRASRFGAEVVRGAAARGDRRLAN